MLKENFSAMHSLADPNNTVHISMFYLLVFFLSKYTWVYTEKKFQKWDHTIHAFCQ